ncbi:MAG: ribonuclease HI family protein [Candidatus Thermoplasmatota archaeon]|nr:ribonuclease HI family protein [Candidatus Thermoplasmatota archaeon]
MALVSQALLPKVLVYTDGGSRGNPGPAAIGIVLCDSFDDTLAEHRESIGRATNNEAEYRALIKGLDLAPRYTRQRVECHTDSQLVVSQLNGTFQIREPRLSELASAVQLKVIKFIEVYFHQVSRRHTKIQRADELVNMALNERYGHG